MDIPNHLELSLLGLVGSGISIGVRLGRGEKINPWTVISTLSAGLIASGYCTEALISSAGLEPYWAGPVALLVGLMVMGFVINAIDGNIPFINKYVGGKRDGDDK